MRSVWMNELTSDDIEEYLERDTTVIVPIGSTESHGPHLPMGTDTYEAIDYSEEIAKRADILCTPPIWFGDSPHHMGRPGTISLRSQTVIALLRDVYRSLIHHGFRGIITFNGHRLANLPVIQIAAKEVKENHPDVLFACFDPVQIAAETHQRIRTAPGEAIHGGGVRDLAHAVQASGLGPSREVRAQPRHVYRLALRGPRPLCAWGSRDVDHHMAGPAQGDPEGPPRRPTGGQHREGKGTLGGDRFERG